MNASSAIIGPATTPLTSRAGMTTASAAPQRRRQGRDGTRAETKPRLTSPAPAKRTVAEAVIHFPAKHGGRDGLARTAMPNAIRKDHARATGPPCRR